MLTPEIIARVDAWLAERRRVGMTDRMAALAHEWSRRPFRMATARTDAAREAVDSAMCGVLLALVREAWGDPTISTCSEPSFDHGHVWRIAMLVEAKLAIHERYWMNLGGRLWTLTEADALVSALEASPT